MLCPTSLKCENALCVQMAQMQGEGKVTAEHKRQRTSLTTAKLPLPSVAPNV